METSLYQQHPTIGEKKPDEDGSGSDELAGEPVIWKVVSSAECF
jgi:hypothetical protein